MSTVRNVPVAAVLVATLILLAAAAVARAEEGPLIHVFKTPWCGCCAAWADRMEEAGYRTRITDLEDLEPVRRQAAVPAGMEGCHLAAVEGYVLEGHVPAEAIDKLLAERPAIHGIAVPGMPAGSPGMGDDPSARYDVLTFGAGTAADSRVFYEAGK